jgi:hypothetical protein
MIQGYFIPRFEEVFKKALEEYQEISFEDDIYPQEFLIKNALPESVKQERIAKLKKNSPITRLSEKGYIIAPKKKDSSETHIETEKKRSKDREKAVDLKPSVPVQQKLLEVSQNGN